MTYRNNSKINSPIKVTTITIQVTYDTEENPRPFSADLKERIEEVLRHHPSVLARRYEASVLDVEVEVNQD